MGPSWRCEGPCRKSLIYNQFELEFAVQRAAPSAQRPAPSAQRPAPSAQRPARSQVPGRGGGAFEARSSMFITRN